MHKRYTPEQLAKLNKAMKQYEQSGNDYATIDEYYRSDTFNSTKPKQPIANNKSGRKEKKNNSRNKSL